MTEIKILFAILALEIITVIARQMPFDWWLKILPAQLRLRVYIQGLMECEK